MVIQTIYNFSKLGNEQCLGTTMVQHSVAILLCYNQFSFSSKITWLCVTHKSLGLWCLRQWRTHWWSRIWFLRAFNPISPGQSAEPNSQANCRERQAETWEAGRDERKGFQKKNQPFTCLSTCHCSSTTSFFFFPGERGRTLEKYLYFETVMSIIELGNKRSPKKLEDMDHLDWNIGKALNNHFHILTLACMSHHGCEHNHFLYSVFTEILLDTKSKISFKTICKWIRQSSFSKIL